MRRPLLFTCSTVFYVSTVWSYNANREDSCSYYENPELAPLLSGRFRDTYNDDDAPNLDVFFSEQDKEPEEEDILKKFNFRYLNVDQPIASLDDFIQMNSDEIGTAPLPEPKINPIVWNLDEVKSVGVPEVLPDVGLNLAGQEQIVERPPQILDEYEMKLGRKLVDDSPRFPDVMGVEKSLTQEVRDMKETEINESYLKSPEYYQGPSVVLNNIVQRKEPDFMQQLQQMKMTNLKSMQSEITNDEELEKVDDYYRHTTTERSTEPHIEFSTRSPVLENTIEKTSNGIPVQDFPESVKIENAESQKITEPSRRPHSNRRRSRKKIFRIPETQKAKEETKNDGQASPAVEIEGNKQTVFGDILSGM